MKHPPIHSVRLVKSFNHKEEPLAYWNHEHRRTFATSMPRRGKTERRNQKNHTVNTEVLGIACVLSPLLCMRIREIAVDETKKISALQYNVSHWICVFGAGAGPRTPQSRREARGSESSRRATAAAVPDKGSRSRPAPSRNRPKPWVSLDPPLWTVEGLYVWINLSLKATGIKPPCNYVNPLFVWSDVRCSQARSDRS